MDKKKPSRQTCTPENIALARQVHRQLVQNLDQRFTIQVLARQYMVNTTTLKLVFKAVYGASLGAHIKAHRLSQAALMLAQTKTSVAQIARQVGYENQSKFTAAFKTQYGVLPTAYRKGKRQVSLPQDPSPV